MNSFEESRLFRGLSPAELELVKSVVQERAYPADTIIFKEGDLGDGLYVVKSGLVQIGTAVSMSEHRILSKLRPSESFGDMAVLDHEPRSASASAEQDTVVYFIPREDLLRLLEKIPKLSASLVREVSQRLRDFNKHYVNEVLQAERLSLVGRFVRSIVHDLKNPLNIIGIAAEMGGADSASPEMRVSGRNRIRKQVDRINTMVNELLEFTRGSNTSFVPALTEYDEFVKPLVEEIAIELELKSVTVEYENQPPATAVQINPDRLSRVFYNLLHNAADAMPEGGRIILRFITTEKEVVTEVEDTGSGIAQEIADKLFQPFATFGKAHGTGLGLSICKKIIDDHRGRIYTRSEPGRGAIFVFHLPLRA